MKVPYETNNLMKEKLRNATVERIELEVVSAEVS